MARRSIGISVFAIAASSIIAATAGATPSTQVWIPSPDVQDFGTLHLNSDVYARPGKASVFMLGPTAGVSPWEKLEAEIGFDLLFTGNQDLDSYPLYFHGKLGTPEDTFFKGAPSVAAGVYNVGIKPGLTTQNMAYGLVGRTLPVVGRFSAGYYVGNGEVLVDETGAASDNGLLLSWDRTMTEIDERLWLAVDYQGGNSAMSAVSAGVAWAFSPNVSVIAGGDHYLNQEVAGKDTVTLQLDINMF